MHDYPALALLEFKSIAVGIMAGDAMVKQSPVPAFYAGTVQPGHYLVMVSGDVATVDEALKAGQEAAGNDLTDHVYLPNVHPAVIAGLLGKRQPPANDALGIIETHTVSAGISAADIALKGTEVTLVKLRLADGLGGKGLVLLTGLVADIQEGVEIAGNAVKDQLIRQIVIPQLHEDLLASINLNRFGSHFNWGIA